MIVAVSSSLVSAQTDRAGASGPSAAEQAVTFQSMSAFAADSLNGSAAFGADGTGSIRTSLSRSGSFNDKAAIASGKGTGVGLGGSVRAAPTPAMSPIKEGTKGPGL